MTIGRGSNPTSRKNLTGTMRDSYVYERGAGIGWTAIAGPMAFHLAYAWARRLEALNHTGSPLYAAMRGQG